LFKGLRGDPNEPTGNEPTGLKIFFDGRRASSSALGDDWLAWMHESGRRV
jgi:hypothetical protein